MWIFIQKVEILSFIYYTNSDQIYFLFKNTLKASLKILL